MHVLRVRQTVDEREVLAFAGVLRVQIQNKSGVYRHRENEEEQKTAHLEERRMRTHLMVHGRSESLQGKEKLFSFDLEVAERCSLLDE